MNMLLPWHETHWNRLIERARSRTLPHALLLTGPRGLGKEHFTVVFTQALLCEAPAADGQACGVCRSCGLFQAGTHPDYSRLSPLEPGKDIKVDQVREAIAYLQLKPHFASRKVLVIVPVDEMNVSSSNSLLKTLEEPAPGALLILVTHRPTVLPATVLSRCQRIVFTPPLMETARAWVMEKLPHAQDADLLLNLAGGSPLLAVKMGEGETLQLRRDLFEDLGKLARRQDDPVAVAGKWSKHVNDSLGWILSGLMDMIRLKASGEPPCLANRDMQQHLSSWSHALDVKHLYRHLDRAGEALRLLDGQINAELLMEDFMIAWAAGFAKSGV